MQGLHKVLLLHVLTCLVQKGHGSKIIHGEIVPDDSMQYMVSVQNTTGHHVCGGFLISDEFVLTAAHCDQYKPVNVVLGSHNLRDKDKIINGSIKQKNKHPDYKNVNLGSDIMLLKLSEKVDVNNRIVTIQLPDCDMNIKENQTCRVAGWGKNESSSHTVDQLRMVDVNVTNKQLCERKWSGLPANVICAGGYGTNKGFCQGDSGGPLVCNGKAFGVVSFNRHRNCKYPDVPNVYTDISKYVPWINSIIRC